MTQYQHIITGQLADYLHSVDEEEQHLLRRLKEFEERGADLSTSQNCALHVSSRYGNVPALKFLHSKGIDLTLNNETDDSLTSALRITSTFGHIEATIYVASLCSDIKAANVACFRNAFLSQDKSVFYYINKLTRSEVNALPLLLKVYFKVKKRSPLKYLQSSPQWHKEHVLPFISNI